jgi:hypothetical protein
MIAGWQLATHVDAGFRHEVARHADGAFGSRIVAAVVTESVGEEQT